MKRTLIALLCSMPAFATLPTTTVWEVRTAGANTNGGGFDPVTGSGHTDYSVNDNKNASGCTSCGSTTENLSTTDAITNNTTTVTSATANFTSALIGNLIYLTGTGTTTGWYAVSAVTNSTTITVDRATGSTGGSGVTMNIGGALGTVVQACASGNVAASHTIWVKAGTYSSATTQTCAQNGAAGSPIQINGYTSTRGDGGSFTLRATAGSIAVFTPSGQYYTFRNMVIDCNSQTSSTGLNMTGGFHTYTNLTVQGGCALRGARIQGMAVIRNSTITAAASGCAASLSSEWRMILIGSRIYGNACPVVVAATAGFSAIHNLIYGNTGANTDGISFNISGANTTPQWLINNTFYGNGRDGIRATVSGGLEGVAMYNNVFVSNTGYGVSSDVTVYNAGPYAFNAFYDDTVSNFPSGNTGDVTLSADPFVNAAGGNFALNATAGGGAALKAAAFPGAFPGGSTTGYLDIGAAQHQDTGTPAAGGASAHTFIQ